MKRIDPLRHLRKQSRNWSVKEEDTPGGEMFAVAGVLQIRDTGKLTTSWRKKSAGISESI